MVYVLPFLNCDGEKKSHHPNRPLQKGEIFLVKLSIVIKLLAISG
jgi:hypothetical protein